MGAGSATSASGNRAALCLRISTDLGKQDADNQRHQLSRLCEAQGWEVVIAYEDHETGSRSDRAQFRQMMLNASTREWDLLVFLCYRRKRVRVWVEELKVVRWTGSPRTDADSQGEFRYQPEGWGKAYRFVALRYQKKPKPKPPQEPEQYQLFDAPGYGYRVFVTNLDAPIDVVMGFYRQRAGAENQIKEANNDAGLAARLSARWYMNCVQFQLAMLAYN